MKRARKVNTGTGVAALLILCLISILTLAYSSAVNSELPQAVLVLVSMGLLFYSSHPLGHYFAARIFGIGVDHFYFGRSDFRRLKTPMKVIWNAFPTVGTKLNRSELESLGQREKGYIYGAGVIASNALVGIQLAYVLAKALSFSAILLGAIFLVGNIALELVFSTKVGDLSKMRNPTPSKELAPSPASG